MVMFNGLQFITLINFIMPITVGILTLMSRITSFEDSNLNIQLIFAILKFNKGYSSKT